MRMVVSLGDLDDSRWINLTGVSGHPADAHYTDQTDLWADGRDPALGLLRAAPSTAAAEDTLALPGSPGGLRSAPTAIAGDRRGG